MARPLSTSCWIVSLAAPCLLLCSCADAPAPKQPLAEHPATDKIPLHPAGGKVAFPDGEPLRRGSVNFFLPVDDGASSSIAASGEIQRDGTFKLTSYEQGNGAPAGIYRVAFRFDQVLDPDATATPAGSVIDTLHTTTAVVAYKYQDPDISGIVCEVVAGDNNDFVIEVEKPGQERKLDLLDMQRISVMASQYYLSHGALLGDANRYAWELFLFANWPAGEQGTYLPNVEAKIHDTGPRHFETWKQSVDVFLADGAKPGPYGEPHHPPGEVLRQAKRLGLDADRPFHHLDATRQVDGLTLEDRYGQVIRYQILMNELVVEYIRRNKIYSLDGQQAVARGRGIDVVFPWGSLEAKTSWMWLPEDEAERKTLEGKYWTANAYYRVSGGEYRVGKAALTGMHLMVKIRDNWVWMTFENVHNPTYTNARAELEIPPRAAQANGRFQQALQGTVFANYQLMGVQTEFVEPGNGQATLLANSQMESAFQQASSCITCHARASISTQSQGPGRLSFRDAKANGGEFYIGKPPREVGFKPLDFVWSLRLAK